MASIIDEFSYDVFLSFRGEETRYGFTGNLKKALDDNGVRTFMDDVELQKGDEITPSLLQAIDDSKIAIVVLSENYATSSFCLQELYKIVDSMKDKADRSILPVFYMVDPSDVRKLKRSYEDAMKKYDEASSSSNHDLDKWKMSLQQVADMSGFHYKGDMYEHEFIGKIVEDVLKKITFEDMGKDIVRQESPNPGERSRLWASEDINEVLRENKEKSKIGIIYVNNWIKFKRDGEAFNKMENLKTLLIDKYGRFDRNLKHLPNSLRVLDSRSYSTDATQVVFSNKKFQNMRVLNFDFERSWGDVFLPIHDLSNLPNLEELSIKNYRGEFTSDKPVCLSNLKILRLKGCSKIRIIPLHMLHSLEELNLNDCTSLESFSHVVGLGEKLKTMSVRSCDKLRSIPHLRLTSLEELDLTNCTSLQNFPLVVDEFLGKLKILRLENCNNLKSIPPLKLDVLEELDLSKLYMVESFLLSVGEFLGKVKILRLKGCPNLKSIPPLKLDSLEKLDLSYCHNLWSIPHLKLDSLKEVDLSHCYSLDSFPSAGDGLLEHIRLFNIKQCILLKSIPPLRVTSLQMLNISHCLSLESFPEILGDIRSIPELHLDNIPKKLLPLPLQNLTPPHTSYPCNCGIIDFPNRVAEVSMLAESTIESGGNVSPMKSSHVEYICLHNGKLSDEYWSISFMLFANVKELHLANNQFTVLPKSMEKCNFLWRLVLDDCVELQEIKGIPPCLKVLSALNCQLLTSSSKSKLLNQKLHEAGDTWFRLPRAKIPEWFDHQCPAGLSISFWFRNKFPAIALCIVSPLTLENSRRHVRVIINGNTFFYICDDTRHKSPAKMYHLHLFHMKMEKFNDNMDKALFENKWNHAEVDFGFPFMYSGIHVLKDKSSMEDIQLTNPEIELY
ncbi:disease resistance protein RPV1 [Trifolium repens]|nr:disease resistance protein RPV1 [Trifolium repens]